MLQVGGAGIGMGGVSLPSALYASQDSQGQQEGGSGLIQETPGNRLYVDQTGKIHLPQHHPAYVAGQMLRAQWDRWTGAFGSLTGRVRAMFQTSSANACSDPIMTQYPNLDSGSRSAVQDLCAPGASSVVIQKANIDTPAAVAQALAQTSATSVAFSEVICDSGALIGDVMVVVPPPVNILEMNIYDNRVTRTNPSSITEAGAITALQKLPCTNVTSFELGFVTWTNETATAWATTLTNNPFFPAQALKFSWRDYGEPFDSQFERLVPGLQANQCLRTLVIGEQTGITANVLLSLLQGNTSIANYKIWCVDPMPLTDAQKANILAAIEVNPCFVSISNMLSYPCFTTEFTEAVGNLTLGRAKAPCPPDSRCGVPMNNCTLPATPVAAPSTSLLQSPAFQGGVGGGGVLLVAFVAGFVLRDRIKTRCCRPHHRPISTQKRIFPREIPLDAARGRLNRPPSVEEKSISELQPGAGVEGREPSVSLEGPRRDPTVPVV